MADYSDANKSALTVGLSLLIFFTLLSNSLVLVVLLCRARRLLKKPLYVFICSICVSDVLATLFTMTFEVSEEVTHVWMFGEPACKAIEYLEFTLFGVNIFTHLSIAIERYRNVVQPLKPQMKRKTAKTLVAASWGVPSLMALPYLYTLRLMKQSDGSDICVTVAMPWTWLDKLYLAAELLVVFLIPLICIFWMYLVIVHRLYQKKRQANVVLPAPHHTSMRAAATRGSRVSIAVATVFVLCWLPLCLVYIVRLFTSSESANRTSALYITALYSSFASELLTPILYCAFDSNIKPALMATLRCRPRSVLPSDESHSHSEAEGTVRSRNGTVVQPSDPGSRDASVPRNSIDS